MLCCICFVWWGLPALYPSGRVTSAHGIQEVSVAVAATQLPPPPPPILPPSWSWPLRPHPPKPTRIREAGTTSRTPTAHDAYPGNPSDLAWAETPASALARAESSVGRLVSHRWQARCTICGRNDSWLKRSEGPYAFVRWGSAGACRTGHWPFEVAAPALLLHGHGRLGA